MWQTLSLNKEKDSKQKTPPGFPGVAYGCGDTFCAQAALPAPQTHSGVISQIFVRTRRTSSCCAVTEA